MKSHVKLLIGILVLGVCGFVALFVLGRPYYVGARQPTFDDAGLKRFGTINATITKLSNEPNPDEFKADTEVILYYLHEDEVRSSLRIVGCTPYFVDYYLMEPFIKGRPKYWAIEFRGVRESGHLYVSTIEGKRIQLERSPLSNLQLYSNFPEYEMRKKSGRTAQSLPSFDVKAMMLRKLEPSEVNSTQRPLAGEIFRREYYKDGAISQAFVILLKPELN